MARRIRQLLLLGGLGAAACNGLSTGAEQPALIARSTPESFAEISGVLREALGPREILLAPDLFTQSSILALEQGQGAPSAATGRVVELPERFELILNGERCFVVRSSTGDRWRLTQTDCVPVGR